MFLQQHNLGRRYGDSKMHLSSHPSPGVAYTAVRFMVQRGRDTTGTQTKTYICVKSQTIARQERRELQHLKTKPQGYKTFFVLNSTEHKIYPAHKC